MTGFEGDLAAELYVKICEIRNRLADENPGNGVSINIKIISAVEAVLIQCLANTIRGQSAENRAKLLDVAVSKIRVMAEQFALEDESFSNS